MFVKLNLHVAIIVVSMRSSWAGNADDYCYDDPYYVWHGKDCEEIADSGKCDVVLSNDAIIGEVYCPVSCYKCYGDYDESSLTVIKDCFEYGEDIVAHFVNAGPHKNDAVAIWPHDENHPVHFDTDLELWDWLCYGEDLDHGEHCKSYYGKIVMNHYASGTWPLPKDYYIIILKKAGKNEDIKAYDFFYIGDCSKPIPAPTKPVSYPNKPKPSPTKEPIAKPVPALAKPYPTPTKPVPHPECYDEIYTEYECYGKGEAILVYFYQCNPRDHDWIGTFESYEDGDHLPEEYYPWQYLCGGHHCREAVKEGHLVFEDGTYGRWPLPPGEYKFHIVREGYFPYESYAEIWFVIKENEEDCYDYPHPAPYPTKYDKPYPSHSKPVSTPSKPAPTPYHYECTDSVETAMTCYDKSDDGVVVDITNCGPHNMDWIGIYHASDDPHYLGHPIAWAYSLCGSTSFCKPWLDLVETDYVKFSGLPVGEYRAHLIGDHSAFGPYEAKASSGEFYVKKDYICKEPLFVRLRKMG